MALTNSELNHILERFAGEPCEAPTIPRSGSQLFSNCLDWSPFHASTTFGIPSDIANIGAFMSYNLLSIINHAPLTSRRFLNNQWYLFKQLPLCVAIKEDTLPNTILIENPTSLSWPEFSKACQSSDKSGDAAPMATEIGHQITIIPFGYKGQITRRPNLPHVAVSYIPRELTLSLTTPRMNCMPVEFNRLFNNICDYLSTTCHPQAQNTMDM
jgi:hypothetical protein